MKHRWMLKDKKKKKIHLPRLESQTTQNIKHRKLSKELLTSNRGM